MKSSKSFYFNIKWITIIFPILGVGIFEIMRFQVLNKYFDHLTNSLLLMIVVGVFAIFFSSWLFKKIQAIHNSLFWEQQRLKTIFEHTSDGIIVLDENCQVIDLNPAAEKLTGWSKKEVVKKISCDAMNGCSKSKEACWNSPNPDCCMNVDCGHRECWGKTCLIKHISIPYIEMCLLRKDGKKTKIAASYSYIPAIGEEKPQVKLVLRDISERKEFEKAIQNYATLEERYRLAREMHDGLAQNLVYLNIKVHNMQKKLEEQGNSDTVIKDLVEMRQVTREAVNEVRQNIFALKTSPMEEVSCFRVWIKDYLNYFGTINHIETEFNCVCMEMLILPTDIKVQLIRIIQEALTNIGKHARATKTNVSLIKNDKEIIIRIADNGQGIDFNKIKIAGKGHYGLSIMGERAQIIGGNLKILPGETGGTLVELRLPLTNIEIRK